MSDVAALVRTAVATLEEAARERPAGSGYRVDLGERAVVAVRDALIERQRAGESVRGQLTRANTALSLIAGVEHPAVGIQLGPLREARDLMREAASELERGGGALS